MKILKQIEEQLINDVKHKFMNEEQKFNDLKAKLHEAQNSGQITDELHIGEFFDEEISFTLNNNTIYRLGEKFYRVHWGLDRDLYAHDNDIWYFEKLFPAITLKNLHELSHLDDHLTNEPVIEILLNNEIFRKQIVNELKAKGNERFTR